MGIPSREYDIATSARPEEVQRIFHKTIPLGAAFGVIVVLYGGSQFEVATFRADGQYIDGRHPVRVTFTDAKEDVLRRDFTINGLLYDPHEERVIDHVGGEHDIRARIIRAIGDPYARFGEDKLRMLRAIRFSARLGFTIESSTYRAIGDLKHEIHEVSVERIREELNKILIEGGAREGFIHLDETGLLSEILPEIDRMKGIEQPPEFHPEGDVFTHTIKMLGLLRNASVTLAWGALLHDVGKPLTMERRERITFYQHDRVGAEVADELLRRLKFSNIHREKICALVLNHLRFIDVQNMRLSTLKRFLRMEDFDEHLEIHRLDCLASHGDLDNHRFCLERLKTLDDVREPVERIITGDDLIGLGYKPGPRFKQILSAVEDEQLENRLKTKEEAIAYVKTAFPPDEEDSGVV